jgi:signal transduction histidine kinase
MAAPESTPENITQELYKRNVELAIKNKTLSLLDKLYEISILWLEPLTLAERITQAIQTELDFDLVGIFHYDDRGDTLKTLHFAKSKRLEDMLGDTNKAFDSLKILDVSKHTLLGPIFSGSAMSYTEDLTQVWGSLIPQNKLEMARKGAHLRTIILYPLTIRNRKILGILIVGLNRSYDNLGEFEQEAIRNFVNVIATALDKTLIYQELQKLTTELARANEELKRLDKAKSEFVSIASHQLRTPLTAIKGYMSMILEGSYGNLNETQHKPMKNIYESNERLINLVNDLLNISRIESGKTDMKWAKKNIADVIKGTIEEIGIKAQEKKLKLVFENPEEPTPQVNLDEEKIRNVLLNILDNAIRYTKKGKITIRAYQKQEDSQKNSGVVVEVKDTGDGMTQEELSHLFESFSRGRAGTRMSTEGAGLGLYIAKQFMNLHKGKIWAESQGRGEGSTFFVELPIQ